MSIIIGAPQTAASRSLGSGGTLPWVWWEPFTAVLSGTLTKLGISVTGGVVGTAAVLVIYDNSGSTLLGQTGSFTLVSGANVAPLLSSVAITDASVYNLGVFYNAGQYFNAIYEDGGTSASVSYMYGVTTTYPTPPSTLTATGGFSGAPVASLWGETAAVPSQKGGMFFADNFRPKIPVVAATMFMPLRWIMDRRDKLARERKAVRETLKNGR